MLSLERSLKSDVQTDSEKQSGRKNFWLNKLGNKALLSWRIPMNIISMLKF